MRRQRRPFFMNEPPMSENGSSDAGGVIGIVLLDQADGSEVLCKCRHVEDSAPYVTD
jgi:hypothetical protein